MSTASFLAARAGFGGLGAGWFAGAYRRQAGAGHARLGDACAASSDSADDMARRLRAGSMKCRSLTRTGAEAHDDRPAGLAGPRRLAALKLSDLFAADPDAVAGAGARGRRHPLSIGRRPISTTRPSIPPSRRSPRRRLRRRREALFAGEIVNPTEGRAAEHTRRARPGRAGAASHAAQALHAADAGADRRDRGAGRSARFATCSTSASAVRRSGPTCWSTRSAASRPL